MSEKPRKPRKPRKKKMEIKEVEAKEEKPSQPSPRFSMIGNQMMRGFEGGDLPAAEVVASFREQYKDVIVWVDVNSPRVSAGVLGAIAKGVMWYGREKMQPFCNALKKGDFRGQTDPAHQLYMWLMGRGVSYPTKDVYRRTVTAIRYHASGRPMKWHLKAADTDLFEWANNYTKMVCRLANHPTVMRSAEEPLTDEQIAAEVDALCLSK